MLVSWKLKQAFTPIVDYNLFLHSFWYLGAESVEDPGVEDDSQDEGKDEDSTEQIKT